MQLKFQKNLNKDQGHTNLVEQKYFELANTMVHNKFLKHSHWVTQATYPVTQETNKRRYGTFNNGMNHKNCTTKCDF